MSFEELRKECYDAGTLFEDSEFPIPGNVAENVAYMRPREMLERQGQGLKPELFVEGASRHDVKQGSLGDCWMLAALSAIADNKTMMEQVLPSGQSFDDDWYAGIFCFRFWRFGKWTEVIVDDRLPARINGRLCYVESWSRNEFWAALLEKAYAKMLGSYEALIGGYPDEALTDLTGGISETILWKKQTSSELTEVELNEMFKVALERKDIISASVNYDGNKEKGIIGHHAYTITGAETVKIGDIPEEIVRIRNPWGNELEWNGDWSDGSHCWNDTDKKELLVKELNGEFWMPVSAFMIEFDQVTICTAFDNTLRGNSTFNGTLMDSMNTSGYEVELADEDDDGKCSLLVELIKNRTSKNSCKDIALSLLVRETDFPCKVKLKAGAWGIHRQIGARCLLPPGRYTILPLAEYNTDISFTLRICTERSMKAGEQDNSETSIKPEDRDPKLTEEMIERAFDGVAEGGQITRPQFRVALNDFLLRSHDNIDVEHCNNLFRIADYPRTGSISRKKFEYIISLVSECMTVFYTLDTDFELFLTIPQLLEAFEKLIPDSPIVVTEATFKGFVNYYGEDGVLMLSGSIYLLTFFIDALRPKSGRTKRSAPTSIDEGINNLLLKISAAPDVLCEKCALGSSKK